MKKIKKLGDYVISTIKEFDLTSENIFKIQKFYEKDLTKINPTYFSKICSTTSLFIFLIKDALEYSGAVIIDKKTPIPKIYKNFVYSLEILDVKISKGINLVNFLENSLKNSIK